MTPAHTAASDGKGEREPPVVDDAGRMFGRGEDAHRIGPDGVKGHVAQVEQAREPDDDVQSQSHQEIQADNVEDFAQIQAQEHRQQQEKNDADADGSPAQAAAACGGRLFSLL